MREAEIKHARLAMLAAVGWPISELWHKNIASVFGLQSILASNDKAPSLLNGGLSNVWATAILMMSIIIGGILEGKAMNSGEIFWGADKPVGYVPGNYGFDPLNLYKARGLKYFYLFIFFFLFYLVLFIVYFTILIYFSINYYFNFCFVY
jgi:hypothetical protein